MPEPYYEDERVTLYCGDCHEVMAAMPSESVDCIITDPPYAEQCHSRARRTSAGGIISGITEFGSVTVADLREVVVEMGRVSRGWVIGTMDHRHAIAFEESPPVGLALKRIGIWVKTNPTPQLSGDRPAHGWEAIAYLHKADMRSRWNGGGLHGNYTMRIADPEGHPTAKPLPLIQDLVRKFTNRGDRIFDPFAGSGTTLRAAINEGRRAIGVEIEERYCELIAKRLDQMCLDFGDAS